MTQTEYSRRRGCSESAVRKAIATGRISGAVRELEDGTRDIDAELADVLWKARTNPSRGGRREVRRWNGREVVVVGTPGKAASGPQGAPAAPTPTWLTPMVSLAVAGPVATPDEVDEVVAMVDQDDGSTGTVAAACMVTFYVAAQAGGEDHPVEVGLAAQAGGEDHPVEVGLELLFPRDVAHGLLVRAKVT